MSALSADEVELIAEAKDLIIQQALDLNIAVPDPDGEKKEYRNAHVKQISKRLTDLMERKGPR